MSEFKKFDLLESIIEQVALKGYQEPTAIQKECIPALIKGQDVLGIAQTGTGKTAAFALPIINKFGKKKKAVKPKCVRSLILTPTRELATQIMENIDTYAQGLNLKTRVVYGGVKKNKQVQDISLGLDILVATPGRLLDIISSGEIDFRQLEVFVLDEADTMLDMGFFNDVRSIVGHLPKVRQTALFSATMPPKIEALAQRILKTPLKVEVAPESTTVKLVEQKICLLVKADKMPLLQKILENPEIETALIFCKTKMGSDIVADGLKELGISAVSIHSDKTQNNRDEALQDFKDHKVRVLVATDVAARGIDVDNISLVVNYNLPEDPRNYVHRIGRTARAGKAGTAISFVVENDIPVLKSIEENIGQTIPIDSDQPYHKAFKLIVKKTKAQLKAKKKKKKKKK